MIRSYLPPDCQIVISISMALSSAVKRSERLIILERLYRNYRKIFNETITIQITI